MKFDVVAHFNRPVAGRRMASTRDGGVDHVFAETPESAARMWLWRLGSDQRSVVVRVIVWPPKPHRVVETYRGPTIVYERRDGALIEVEQRQSPPRQLGR